MQVLSKAMERRKKRLQIKPNVVVVKRDEWEALLELAEMAKEIKRYYESLKNRAKKEPQEEAAKK